MTTEIKGGLLAQGSDSEACQRCEGRGVLYDEEALDCDACGGSGRAVSAQAVFTPGPWEVGEFATHLDGVHIWAQPKRGRGRFASSRRIAQADNRGNQDEMHANARLIAAAPDLYEALRRMLADVEAYKANPGGHAPTHVVADAIAALAKAEGRSDPKGPPGPAAAAPQETP